MSMNMPDSSEQSSDGVRKYDLGKKSPIPTVLLLIAISMCGIISALVFNSYNLDRLAGENMRQRVSIALSVEARRQQELLEEYSYWDEAHENTIVTLDPEWVESNTGKYLIGKYGFEFTLTVNGDLSLSQIATSEKLPSLPFPQLLDAGLGRLLKQLRQSQSKDALSVYMELDDAVYLVSAGLFMDEATETPHADHSVLVFARRVDAAFVEEIVDTYKLPSLTLLPRDGAHEGDYLKILDQSGAVISYLHWDEVRPSRAQLPGLLAIVALLFAVSMVIIRHLLLKEHAYRKLYEGQLYQLATKDFLTGISNRREFLHLAEREIRRAARGGDRLSLLLLDIDRFKKINDTLGHEAGDRVLMEISALIRKHLRDFDVFARFGGEEFVILLPAVAASQAAGKAERLRLLVEDHAIILDDGGRVQVTFSAGVAEWNKEEDLDRLMVRADHALYQAKDAGRNQVVLSPSPNPRESFARSAGG